MMTLEGHKEAVSSLVWLGDRELVSASWDHTMIVWDMEHVTQKATLVSYELIHVGIRIYRYPQQKKFLNTDSRVK